MAKRHDFSMLLKTYRTIWAKSLPEDLFGGRRTTSATPNQHLSSGWAEKYFFSTHQLPTEGRVSMEYAMWVLARTDSQSATELNMYLQSQGPRDQSKACLHNAASPMRVSGQNLTCVPGNLGANLNTKNCVCVFSEILKEEHLLAKPSKVGQKETML